MKRHIHTTLLLLLGFSFTLHAQSKEEFKDRRNHFIQKMAGRSAAIFKNEPISRGNGQYRSDSNFYYLTGWTEPNAILILFKRRSFIPNIQKFSNELLLVPKPRSSRAAQFDGASATLKKITGEMNFDAVATLDIYNEMVTTIFSRFDTIYFELPRVNLNDPLTKEMALVKNAKDRFFEFKVVNPRSIFAEMRSIKSAAEIEILKKAIEITCQAHREVMRSAQPGMFEYELESVIEYVFHRNGAFFPGFPSIVGSGPNALILHYDKNIRKTKPGDLVVMDIGAEYQMYTADITRTMPVSGKFSPAQAEIYQIVLDAQEAAFKQIKPGNTYQDIGKAVRDVFQQKGWAKYLPHGVSHPIGLDVHDISGYRGELKPGMIITLEPGLYIPDGSDVDEKYWNIGIRIEDDVLVTETGHQILSMSAPKTIREIETIMKEKGVGNFKLK